jgi:hypothetical protein
MTVASSCVRPAVRASAKAAHRSREHRRREQDPRPEGDRGRRDACGTRPGIDVSPSVRLAVQYMLANVRVTATALNRADVVATGMRDQSRLIVRADSSITASC